jgi:hypothetical protein
MLEKLKDSYLFMICAREALSLYMSNACLEKDKKDNITNYLVNESTDYEILYLLVENDFPKKIYDHVDEHRCLSIINSFLKDNKYIFENYDFNEIVSLKDWNLSSQKSVADFVLENNLVIKNKKCSCFVNENILDKKESRLSELMMLSAILYASYKAYKAKRDRLSERCNKLVDSKEKADCLKKSAISAYKTHSIRLRSSYPMCRGTKNPAKCRMSIKKKVLEIEKKIKDIETSLEQN